uniref:Uncharacterized protein n=1 Tax=Arundo donax TaxID=35708 RepID=A0A0A9CF88_ARUDO
MARFDSLPRTCMASSNSNSLLPASFSFTRFWSPLIHFGSLNRLLYSLRLCRFFGRSNTPSKQLLKPRFASDCTANDSRQLRPASVEQNSRQFFLLMPVTARLRNPVSLRMSCRTAFPLAIFTAPSVCRAFSFLMPCGT